MTLSPSLVWTVQAAVSAALCGLYGGAFVGVFSRTWEGRGWGHRRYFRAVCAGSGKLVCCAVCATWMCRGGRVVGDFVGAKTGDIIPILGQIAPTAVSVALCVIQFKHSECYL